MKERRDRERIQRVGGERQRGRVSRRESRRRVTRVDGDLMSLMRIEVYRAGDLILVQERKENEE